MWKFRWKTLKLGVGILIVAGLLARIFLTKFASPFPKKAVAAVEFDIPSDEVRAYLDIFNGMGRVGSDIKIFRTLTSKAQLISPILKERIDKISKDLEAETITLARNLRKPKVKNDVTINLATVACEPRGRDEAMVMIKSAVIFSQDSNLNLVIFTDCRTLPSLFSQLLKLKWTANTRGWDFTFELHLEWFPDASWREMWRPCSTQRIFFPKLLPHLDAVLYLDADTLVISNLTEIWLTLPDQMKNGELMGMSRNTEYPANGFYNMRSKIPYFGFSGLNAGVALMNLTEMRSFRIEQKAFEYFSRYKDNIILADQDIYNIIFHFHPERLYLLDCTFNFYLVHCPVLGNSFECVYHAKEAGPICFCHSVLGEESGVRILHGNQGSFHRDYPFLMEAYQSFLELNLLVKEPSEMILELQDHFSTLKAPCFHLNSKNLYRRAEDYLSNLLKLARQPDSVAILGII